VIKLITIFICIGIYATSTLVIILYRARAWRGLEVTMAWSKIKYSIPSALICFTVLLILTYLTSLWIYFRLCCRIAMLWDIGSTISHKPDHPRCSICPLHTQCSNQQNSIHCGCQVFAWHSNNQFLHLDLSTPKHLLWYVMQIILFFPICENVTTPGPGITLIWTTECHVHQAHHKWHTQLQVPVITHSKTNTPSQCPNYRMPSSAKARHCIDTGNVQSMQT
jgi:hypothetical protein